jgi:predicted translin family RNA/ssDNA-binding protein
MLDTKQREIEKLEEYAFMRDDGLNCSEKMLDQDTRAFIEFFKENKERSTKAIKDAETETKKKQDRTTNLKKIYDEYAVLVSTINKDLESLSEYYEYKVFLD